MNRAGLAAQAADMTVTPTFSHFAGYAGIIAGVSSVLYSCCVPHTEEFVAGSRTARAGQSARSGGLDNALYAVAPDR